MVVNSKQIQDHEWTLFLDRDGVINRRLPGSYVQNSSEFAFLEGALSSIKIFSEIFQRIIIVTNQQGVGKGIMTVEQLHKVHYHMIDNIEAHGGRIDNSYFCPSLVSTKPNCRKPSSNMAIWAQSDFPDIDFAKSIMIGDMPSDIEFGNSLKMITFHVNGDSKVDCDDADYHFKDLHEICSYLLNNKIN